MHAADPSPPRSLPAAMAAGLALGWALLGVPTQAGALPEAPRSPEVAGAREPAPEDLPPWPAWQPLDRRVEQADFASATGRIWMELARIREARGEPRAAEAAWLAAAAAEPDDPRPLVGLAALYARWGWDRDRREALALARERDPGALPRAALLLPAPAAAPPQSPEQPAAAPEPPPRVIVRTPLDVLRERARRDLPERLWPPVEGGLDALEAVPAGELAAGLGLLALAALALPRLRQRGDLAVSLRYPEELRGTFRLRVSKGGGRLRPLEGEARRTAIRKGGTSSRLEHHLVSRETLFPRLPTGRWWVQVEGVLEDAAGHEVLADVLDSQETKVRSRRTVRCEFDLRPRECPVDVALTWNGEAPRHATLVCAAAAESPVTVTGQSVRIWLPRGVHRLVVGCGDRVLEREIEVERYEPTPVSIEIAEASGLLFRGCPPAVDRFLEGDLDGAARALEREGQKEAAHLVLAQQALDAGLLDEAARHFQSGGEARRAAELWEQLGDPLRAAPLYLEAQDPERAARGFQDAGEWARAGEAHERARDFDAAIDCYRRAGDASREVDALDRRGDPFAAAKLALDNGWRARGIRLLRLVTPGSPRWAEACLLLADAFEREGHWDLAAQKLEEHILAGGSGGSSADLQWRLAELFENAGHLERALSLLEELRRSEPTFPNVANKLEVLRGKRSARQASSGEGGLRAASGDFGPPTLLLSNSRYEVLEEIGRGAMGVVLRARDRRLSRTVALKRLPESLRNYPRAVQLFLREAQATARLNHPHIVTVFDADQESGTFFITMELLQGQPLHAVLRDRGPLPVDEVLSIADQVASALDYAHGQGVIHRDVKTANLFLCDEGITKVMDFGLATMLEEVRRAETGIGGTPFYMAPEQIVGGEIDPRADLYALGVTLFELCTGRVPFHEGDVTYHHRHSPPPDPRELQSSLPDPLAELILQLLQKDPADRCASAAEVVHRVRALRDPASS